MRDLVSVGPAAFNSSFLYLCSNVICDKLTLSASSTPFKHITHMHIWINKMQPAEDCVFKGQLGGLGGGFLSFELPSTCGVNMCNAEVCVRG